LQILGLIGFVPGSTDDAKKKYAELRKVILRFFWGVERGKRPDYKLEEVKAPWRLRD
jgi:hypothetical protein